MNKIKIGSFFTTETPYKEVMNRFLLASCVRLNIKPLIAETNNYGNWYRNVAEKPNIVLEFLDNHLKEDECLVLLDADATIEEYPSLFEEIPEEYDIAFHTLDWNLWYGYNQTPSVKELLTGTMFFRNRPEVKNLCKDWYLQAKTNHVWEQKILSKIIANYKLKIYPLPITYCYMISRPSGEPLISDEGVVIKHHQVSRTMKLKKRLT